LLFYYITDRTQFAGNENARRATLLAKIAEAARAGVDFIQLREKDLSARELVSLAEHAVRAVRQNSPSAGPASRILINSRTDIALTAGADGVHLPSGDIAPGDIAPNDVRCIWSQAAARCGRENTPPLVTVSCHSEADVARAAAGRADYALFAPVFEKHGSSNVRGAGLEALRATCRQPIPVLALGGITLGNAPECINADAAGIAAIRLFQENAIAEVVRQLR
jgi:thiamine-phosphate pyrophosphorylase